MNTRGTKRACGLCLTKCGLGLKRIAKMLGVSHPLVKRWRGEAGIDGQVGPKMGNGVLAGTSAYRPEKHQEEAFKSEQSAARVEYGKCCWSKHIECKRRLCAIGAKRRYPTMSERTRWARAIRFRVWKVCKLHGGYKSANTEVLTGATWEQLRNHIQRQFKRGMEWGNYGTVWEVDHIVPCQAFDLTKPEEQMRCFHFTNLRPLSVSANRRKSWVMKQPGQVQLGI